VCGMDVEVAHPGARGTVDGTDYVFCGQGCADAYTSRPSEVELSGSAHARGAVEHPGAPR